MSDSLSVVNDISYISNSGILKSSLEERHVKSMDGINILTMIGNVLIVIEHIEVTKRTRDNS